MANTRPKVEILPGAESDLSAATFRINNESHTIGNALRWMLMKNPKVEFCGYSVPHPSENHIHVRVQMYGTPIPPSFCSSFHQTKFPDKLSSLQALLTALSDLDDLFQTIEGAYRQSLNAGNYERWDEKS
ncbi:hypothetical protein NLI96_g3614 [Meripilus lineatus]|uniref:DNA-directed RNA polymerase RBP11-like dimerisation domain-containing protein n=1 Tax=Meripilus lineatus TaxID=2056292 RepID=A0AAD5V6F3_9APHY|nr:hypothetical protein NLI96_g3614 [Physisporinus lineatus]